MHRFVHAQHHAIAEHRAECRDDTGRRECQIVTQHLLGVLVAVHDEDGLALLPWHRGHVDPLDRFLAPKPGEAPGTGSRTSPETASSNEPKSSRSSKSCLHRTFSSIIAG